MTGSNHNIHIHIGTDNVFEDAFERIANLKTTEPIPQKVNFVPNEMYQKHFRGAVDSGHGFVSNEALEIMGLDSGNLILSRPRFLYTGVPLNTEAGVVKTLYKLDSIQSALAEFKLVFHLCVTDHLTYLFDAKKRDVSLIPDSFVSWQPLVEKVNGRLLPGNELAVHDAENPSSLYEELTGEILGFSKSEAAALCARHSLGTQRNVSQKISEERAIAAGWSVDQLDDCYEKDVWAMFGQN